MRGWECSACEGEGFYRACCDALDPGSWHGHLQHIGRLSVCPECEGEGLKLCGDCRRAIATTWHNDRYWCEACFHAMHDYEEAWERGHGGHAAS